MKKIYDCDQFSFERYSDVDIEYRTTQWTFLRAAVFTSWQQHFLKTFAKIPNEILWSASIHLLEAICTEEDLIAIQSTGTVYRTQGAVRLDWTLPNGRINARELSAISVIALGQSGGDPRCGGNLVSQLPSVLTFVAPDLPKLANPARYLQCCAQAWVFTKLPQFLFAHVIGDTPMAALCREVLARRDSKFALSDFFNSNLNEVEEDFALDGYFHTDTKNESDFAVEKISTSLSMSNPHGLSERQLQIENAKTLRTLTAAAETAGPLSCLILSHCIQMLSSGRHAIGSQISYIKYGSLAVFRSLVGLDLELLTSQDISAAYAKGLEVLSGENLKKAKAYLGHFHNYIREWLDVAPLQQSALPDVPATPIDANVAWPHEREFLQRCIKQQSHLDARLSEQSSLVADLIYACKARGKEIFLLQVRNVRVSNGVVEVEIASWGRLHGLKTDAAQGVSTITDEALAARVLEWKNKRLSEGAESHHLLFGTKGEPQRCYRLGLMYPWLNQTLKFITGDSGSSLHHLRHTAADETFVALEFDEHFHNAMEQLSVDMGHASLKSTRSYLHSFPTLIRKRLDVHLHRLSLSSSTVGGITNIKHSTIRKRNQRTQQMSGEKLTDEKQALQKVIANDLYWTAVSEYASSIHLQESSTDVSLCCPISCPSMAVKRPHSLIDLAWVLRDIQDGYSQQQASRQRGVHADVVSKACAELLRLGNMALREMGELRGVRLTDPRAALIALGVDMARAWQPKFDSWRRHLGNLPIPQMPDDVWECWEDAKSGNYIKISKLLRADLWLGFLVCLKFPTSKMVIKQVSLGAKQMADLEASVLLSIGQGGPLSPAVKPRSFLVKSRDGRPDIYLHIANEDEKVTDHTGAAFETGGLEALMLTIRVASVAVHGRQE